MVDEWLPFHRISIPVHALAILVQQAQNRPLVARDAPKAGKNARQELFQLETGAQLPADRNQALLLLKGVVGFLLLQSQRSHQRDASEEFEVLAIQDLGNALAQAKCSKMTGRAADRKDGV